MQPSTLPAELLQRVLQKVDMPQRLRCCAYVCKAWHAAATAATTSITFNLVEHQQNIGALANWLHRHGSNVLQLSLSEDFETISCVVCLPTPQLTQLELLHCQGVILDMYIGATGLSISNSNGCAPPAIQKASLAQLTRLTSLQLENCTLKLHAGLQALSSLSQLQRLVVSYVVMPDGDEEQQSLHSSSAHVGGHLSHVLPHLVQLTHLTLKTGREADTALQHISCLQGLKELSLNCSTLTSASFTALPQCLTLLQVGDARNVHLTSSTTSAFAQLTALQLLSLDGVAELEPALLSRFVGLRHLSLCRVVQLMPGGAAGATALLAAICRMTELRFLELRSRFWTGDIPAAACAALTASSQLTSLCLLDVCTLPAGAGRFLFTKQLPCLQVLSMMLTGPAGAAAAGGPGQEQLSDIQCTLNSITSSCPRLEDLRLACGEQEEAQLQLDGLLRLQNNLTSLLLAKFKVDGARAAATLAALTGLQELFVVGSREAVQFKYPELLQLTRLQQLRWFKVSAVRRDDGETVDQAQFCNKAEAGAPPDVWQQIHQLCMRNSPECVAQHLLEFQTRLADTQEQLTAARAEVAALRQQQQQLAGQAAGH